MAEKLYVQSGDYQILTDTAKTLTVDIGGNLTVEQITATGKTTVDLLELTGEGAGRGSGGAGQVLTSGGQGNPNYWGGIDLNSINGWPGIPEVGEDGYYVRVNGTNLEYAPVQHLTNTSELFNDSGFLTALDIEPSDLLAILNIVLTSSATGDILVRNALNDGWVNSTNYATSAQGGLADTALQDLTLKSIGELSDVDLAGTVAGKILVWQGAYPGGEFITGTTITSSGTDDINLIAGIGQAVVFGQSGNAVISTPASRNLELSPGLGGVVKLSDQRWPINQGSLGQVLTTDGNGQMSWADAVGSSIGVNDLTDGSTTGNPTGSALVYNGSDYAPSTAIESTGTNDITLTAAVGQAVVFGQAGNAVLSTNAGENIELTPGTGGKVVFGQTGDAVLSSETGSNLKLAPGAGGFVFLANQQWPATFGGAGQVLQTTNTGVLSWENSGGGGGVFQSDSDGDFNPAAVVLNTALQVRNATPGALNTVGILLSTETNGEIYLNAVQNAGNTASDFVVVTRNGAVRAEHMRVSADGTTRLVSGAVGDAENATLNLRGSGDDFYALNMERTAGGAGFHLLPTFTSSPDVLWLGYHTGTGTSYNLLGLKETGAIQFGTYEINQNDFRFVSSTTDYVSISGDIAYNAGGNMQLYGSAHVLYPDETHFSHGTTVALRIKDNGLVLPQSDAGITIGASLPTGTTKNMFSGTFTSSGANDFVIGQYYVATITGAPGDTSHQFGTVFQNHMVTQTASESLTNMAQVFLDVPDITNNLTGGGVITRASSLWIAGAPTEGVKNRSLYVIDDVELEQRRNNQGLLMTNQFSGYTGSVLRMEVDDAASTAFDFLRLYSGGTADVEFRFYGDGNAYADGAWTGGGADYAESFERDPAFVSPDDLAGTSVVLDNGKIRPAVPGEIPMGAVSLNPSVVGDGDIGSWKNKYLRTPYGNYDLDADGKRKSNPLYDDQLEYVSRQDREEWDTIGLVGKLRIDKDQVIAPNWIHMRDIDANVAEYFVFPADAALYKKVAEQEERIQTLESQVQELLAWKNSL